MVASKLGLLGKVPPITAAQLADQQRREAAKHLAPSVPLEQVLYCCTYIVHGYS